MRLILAVAATCLLSAPACAAGDLMASTYGNTVVGKTGPIEGHTHYRADHTFDSSFSSPMGSMQAKGTWAFDSSGKLCRTFEAPPPGMTNPLCVAWAQHAVGDTWQVSGNNGRTTNMSLVKGVQ